MSRSSKKSDIICVLIALLITGGVFFWIFTNMDYDRMKDSKEVTVNYEKVLVPNYFFRGEENTSLSLMMNNFCYSLFCDNTAPWYKGPLDPTTIRIKVCSEMDNKYENLNGSCFGKYFIAISDKIGARNEIDTISVLNSSTKDKTAIESVVIHELIHIYISRYYPLEVTKNPNHIGTFKEIEDYFVGKGLPLDTNYIHDYGEYRKQIKKQKKEDKKRMKEEEKRIRK